MSTRAKSVPERQPRSLAEAIKKARKERGWSQAKLARLLEATETSIQTWEAGRGLPSFALYSRMCLLFEWPLPYSGKSPTARYLSPADWPMPGDPTQGPLGLTLASAMP